VQGALIAKHEVERDDPASTGERCTLSRPFCTAPASCEIRLRYVCCQERQLHQGTGRPTEDMSDANIKYVVVEHGNPAPVSS
jgi:hypothetical protein